MIEGIVVSLISIVVHKFNFKLTFNIPVTVYDIDQGVFGIVKEKKQTFSSSLYKINEFIDEVHYLLGIIVA